MYKGYSILPQYYPGSNYTITENGTIKPRKAKPKDIDFFRTEHKTTGETFPNSLTREEAKRFIDKIESTV